MFTDENKPERIGRLVPTFMAHIATNPKTIPEPTGKISVRNGFSRLGSSVRVSKALQCERDISIYFYIKEKLSDADTRVNLEGRSSTQRRSRELQKKKSYATEENLQ